ncbi:hypothetical protein CC1G_08315 [Coprinopsis cinerea okayama7|uniref:Uncharacterized protein n=1 Tax=Coprinopsis cinerea (strain Okayama-7 / 130 / ATCC MYA-4618 / FGSC 9003) TaxID=240176 RepID=A8NA55_COPC7|nr:hypothetical protein CC1G_08315 [Coprinopsis cinerea okayama7\|eukprot:XP_001831711.1 hypothetical protein CC1G_08315 [Coprinopsis cinerea okayama7\
MSGPAADAPTTPFLSATMEVLGETLGDNMTTEQLLAHAEEISKKISQTFYMNNLGNLTASFMADSSNPGMRSAIDFGFTAKFDVGSTGTSTSVNTDATHGSFSSESGLDSLQANAAGQIHNSSGTTTTTTASTSATASSILSDVELITDAALKAQGLPAEILRNLTEKLSLSGFPPPPFSSGRAELDAIFAAGYEAGLNGAGLGQFRGTSASGTSIPQSKHAPFYRPQFHQSTESPQGAYIEGTVVTNGEDGAMGLGDSSGGANIMPGPPAMMHAPRSFVNGGDPGGGGGGVDIRRRGGRDEDEEDEDGDGDYVDHLRQPGNTKKRKVPANAGMSPFRGGSHRDDGVDEDGVGVAGYGAKRVGPDGGYDDEGEDGGGGGLGGEGHTGDPNGDGGGRGGYSPFNAAPLTTTKAGRMPLPTLSTVTMSLSSSARVGQLNAIVKARGKLSAAMVAGLQHKEMLKARKRQLAAVMGALTQGDSFALDQALSMAGSVYPFGGPLALTGPLSSTSNKENVGVQEEDKTAQQVKVRLSKRMSARLAREVRMKESVQLPSNGVALPSSEFVFQCPSATADRLLATKQEVETLRGRFEAELERQAVQAAKLAAASKMLPPPPANGNANGAPAPATSGTTKSKKKSAQGGSKTKGNSAAKPAQQQQVPQAQSQQTQGRNQQTQKTVGGNQPQPTGNHTLLPPSNKKKKKKRSALANASNPHHLRNYVPSRLPHSGFSPHLANTNVVANFFGPLPLRFLNADIPPTRNRTGGTGSTKSKTNASETLSTSSLSHVGATTGTSEWLCAFCEYDLFYGDDVAFRRAVKSRKKILKRRRRAKERAAAAASGVKRNVNAATGNANPAPANPVGSHPPAPGGVPAQAGDTADEEEYEEEGEDEEDEEFDGDPGYEAGGNGRDEYGNLPKHQTVTKGGGGTGGGGGGGGGRTQNGQVGQAVAARG